MLPYSHMSQQGKLLRLLPALVAFLILFSCTEEPQYWKVDSKELVIGEFISEHPDDYREFSQLVELTDMDALLRIRGPYTLFLPTDAAMHAFYAEKGVSSLQEFEEGFLQDLVLTHLIGARIVSNEIGLGTMREPNALGDYLATEFQGSDIILSKMARITDRDVLAANGVIHVLDHVLDPVAADIFTVIASNPTFSLFSEGLRLSTLADTLQIISFPYGDREARTRFTLLAVADSIYHRNGIYNMDDMLAWTGGHPDSVAFLNSPFYRYFEYHCLTGSHFLSDLNTGIYPILSRDNNLTFTIEDDYKINYDKNTGKYTGFHIPGSNAPAKNGVVHAVNDILPEVIAQPASVIFETTAFFDLQESDYYLNYYKRFFDGENTFAKIKWEADYLLYYYKPIQGGILQHDCLSTRGWWTVSVTFPKVMKGKYEISVFQPGWTSTTDCKVYLDGEPTPYVFRGPLGGTGGTGGLQKVAEAEFLTTEEHTITLRCISPGALFWDYVQFDPID